MSDLLPVSPATVTVLGNRVTADCPSWRGLDLSRAIIREQSTLGMFVFGMDAPPDHHLDVPFAHPDEAPEAWEGVVYRVRPRRKGWRFVKVDGTWMLERQKGAQPEPAKVEGRDA